MGMRIKDIISNDSGSLITIHLCNKPWQVKVLEEEKQNFAICFPYKWGCPDDEVIFSNKSQFLDELEKSYSKGKMSDNDIAEWAKKKIDEGHPDLSEAELQNIAESD
jgi:hypothetical protein